MCVNALYTTATAVVHKQVHGVTFVSPGLEDEGQPLIDFKNQSYALRVKDELLLAEVCSSASCSSYMRCFI
jgi:hypothetical protein